jgi:aspartate/methionine/tyrosine aminotransferase
VSAEAPRAVARPAARFVGIEVSLIRQINALATPLAINLGIGEPNVEPDEEFRDMAARAASSGSWHYTPNAGLARLREQIAEATGANHDPKSEICVTAGTEEGLYSVMLAFVGPGDEVLVPDPGFPAYSVLVRLCGGTAVPYPLVPESWEIDFEALEQRITPATRAIVVNSPSNPTGAVLSEAALDRLVRIAEREGILLVSDEVYSEIYYDSPPASLSGRSDAAIVLNGLSKSHSMTGLRLGWVTAAEELMRTIVMAHQYVATCASSFSQQLASMIFENRGWNERWLGGVRSQFRSQREAALQAVEHGMSAPVREPAGAFYLFVPVPVCDTVSLARSMATEAAVLAIPGLAFGNGGEGFLRISYAADRENIIRGIRRIADHLGRT